MRFPRRRSALVVACALAPAVVLAAPPAAPAAKLERPRTYRASLVVTGGITTKVRRDTTSTCAPGQEWLYTNSAELEVRETVTVHAFGSAVGIESGRATGGIDHRAAISGYRETNNCSPLAPVTLTPPSCTGFRVPSLLLAAATSDRGRVVLSLARDRGPRQRAGVCTPPRIHTGDVGFNASTLEAPGAAITLPLGIRSRAFSTLGRRKKLIRRVSIGGLCAKAKLGTAGNAPAPLDPLDDGECVVDGTINVELTRR